MKNQHRQVIRFGNVIWFDEDVNEGQLKVSGEPEGVWFSLDSQREIVAGFTEPEFLVTAPESSSIPQRWAQVAVVIKVGYDLETPPGHRILRRVVEVTGWNYAFAYQDAKKQIAGRPVYEVVEFRLCNGRPVSVNQREVLNWGTAVALQAVYPRGAKNDPLAPELKVMDFTYRRRFYRRQAGGELVQCDDPRPLPRGVVAEPFQAVNEQGILLANRSDLLKLFVPKDGRPILQAA